MHTQNSNSLKTVVKKNLKKSITNTNTTLFFKLLPLA